ncbi:MAG: glycosyltransferase family 4 protein, partial [Flavisolibacter sp.]
RLKLGRRPKFIILHQGEKPFRGWRRWAQKLADRFIHAYLFTSAEFGKSWNANISVQKMHEVIQASSVFQPGNRQEAKERLELTGDPLYLWVGRLVAGKDPLTVVGVFLKFARLHRGVRLYMIYQSNELLNEVQQLLNHEEDRAAVILVGKIAHEELENWFNAADFIITGSHYEGSGVAIAEAMSCGCIPITTDFISFRKMTGPGRCGFMFDTGNGSSLLHTLEQSIQADRKMEREKVLRQFREELSFEAIARKINAILSS